MREIRSENGQAWDFTAKIYWRDLERDIESLRNYKSSLLKHEQDALSRIKCQGTAYHLQCAGGTDCLSLLLHGFSSVIGVDISQEMIQVGKTKSEQLGWNAKWICADVMDLGELEIQTSDLVYTGRGALPWITNIEEWGQIVSGLLNPGGYLLVHEGHPLDWVWDHGDEQYTLSTSRSSYFADESEFGEDRWPNVFVRDNSEGTHVPVARERQWTLAQIVQAPIDADLQLVSLSEHPEPFWKLYENMSEDNIARLPHSFTAIWQKPLNLSD